MATALFEHLMMVGLIALAASAAVLIFRPRPAFQHLIWMIVLIKLLIPSFLLPKDLAWQPRLQAGTLNLLTANSNDLGEVADQAASSNLLHLSRNRSAHDRRSAGWAESFGASVNRAYSSIGATPESYLYFALFLWMAGSGIVLVRFVIQFSRLSALVRSGQVLDQKHSFMIETADLASRLGIRKTPEIRVITGLNVPIAFWLGRRVILMPVKLIGVDRAMREPIVVHELAHLKRFDHWTGWLESLAVIIWWWFVPTYLIVRRLRQLSEICCDEWVIRMLPGCRRQYAHCLLKLASASPEDTMRCGFVASALGRSKSIVADRIRRLGSAAVGRPISIGHKIAMTSAILAVVPHWSLAINAVQRDTRGPLSHSPLTSPEAEPMASSVEPGQLEQHMAYLAANGGHWFAENPSLEDGAPRRFEYQVAWGLKRQFAKISIQGEYADGRRESYSEVVIFRDPTQKRFMFHQYYACGDIGRGETKIRDDGNEQLDFIKIAVDGQETTHRYLNIRHSPDAFTTKCYRLGDDGAWDLIETLHWKRASKSSVYKDSR